jgi:N-acetylglutamate synthase-like GNAT family acetyltransferase
VSELIQRGYKPGVIGRITELHAKYYSKHWGFGLFFEAKVAKELSEFFSRLDKAHDGFWTVYKDNRIEGSIAIDSKNLKTQGAHLRWFICSSAARGSGIGNKLMEEAISFCQENGFKTVYLWTFEGLLAARHLYEKFGFRLVQQIEDTQWGKKVLEQKFVLDLSDGGENKHFKKVNNYKKLIEEYKQSDRIKRSHMWMKFIELRNDFDEIQPY